MPYLSLSNVALVVSRQCASDWRYVYACDIPVNLNLTGTAGGLGSGYVFPLYLYPEEGSIEWLKDRKGRTLSYSDIQHYRKIIAVLMETSRLMREKDK